EREDEERRSVGGQRREEDGEEREAVVASAAVQRGPPVPARVVRRRLARHRKAPHYSRGPGRVLTARGGRGVLRPFRRGRGPLAASEPHVLPARRVAAAVF